jgi:hypothetical protein
MGRELANMTGRLNGVNEIPQFERFLLNSQTIVAQLVQEPDAARAAVPSEAGAPGMRAYASRNVLSPLVEDTQQPNETNHPPRRCARPCLLAWWRCTFKSRSHGSSLPGSLAVAILYRSRR